MAYTNAFLKRNPTSKSTPSIFNIAMRNNARRRIRSLALVGLLASGLFIVFTVGANRHGTLKGADRRESGTGGFTYFGESTIPVLYDLNSDKGRDFYSLSKDKMSGISVVPFKVKEGDDASCLNLNRITNPNLIGVDPNELDQRKAFTFLKTSNEVDPQNPWLILEKDFGEDVFPGIADQTVIIWGLGKSVGDTLHYVDENGQEFKIKLVGGLANSIFQGNVIISENAFVKKYPSNSGYRIFLVDSPAQQQEETAKTLTWALQDQGFDLIPTTQRLAEFGKVENTYLSIFLILGGLGLIIGSIGLGVVVMRNVLERRGELALLRAVGYSKETIEKLIFTEHIVLLLAGIAIGILAAIFAVLPALLTPGAGIPYLTIFITLFIVMTSGFIFTWFATRMAIRGDLLPALRNE